ncbi:hypothetical protein HA402_002966 [Bradysia odoriphaga]|nr:hypothetical protein HA402_002966 [Bradysia odoriphaga]
MITNYLVGKFVLFVDHTNLEAISEKLLKSSLKSSQIVNIVSLQPIVSLSSQPISIPTAFTQSRPESTLYLPLAELCQTYKICDIFKLIHRHKSQQTAKQIIGWVSVKNVESDFHVPYFEYLANVVVTIKDSVNLSIVSRKSTGSVTKKLFQYQCRDGQLHVKEVKQEIVNKIVEPTIEPESLTTFKINVDEEELVARNALKLPYERSSDNEPQQSKIIYHPDSDDDVDEEDPDDDLDI